MHIKQVLRVLSFSCFSLAVLVATATSGMERPFGAEFTPIVMSYHGGVLPAADFGELMMDVTVFAPHQVSAAKRAALVVWQLSNVPVGDERERSLQDELAALPGGRTLLEAVDWYRHGFGGSALASMRLLMQVVMKCCTRSDEAEYEPVEVSLEEPVVARGFETTFDFGLPYSMHTSPTHRDRAPV